MRKLVNKLFGNVDVNTILLVITLNLTVIFNLVNIVGLTRNRLVVFKTCAAFIIRGITGGVKNTTLSLCVFTTLPLTFLITTTLKLLLRHAIVHCLCKQPLRALLTA